MITCNNNLADLAYLSHLKKSFDYLGETINVGKLMKLCWNMRLPKQIWDLLGLP